MTEPADGGWSIARLFWVATGAVSLSLGALGAVLPVLPTTPFVILAAFAFGKSAPSWRHWLITHKRFGPAIRDWEAHGAIAPRHKALACGMMALAFGGSVVAGVGPLILTIQAVCMGGAAVFVLSRPGGG